VKRSSAAIKNLLNKLKLTARVRVWSHVMIDSPLKRNAVFCSQGSRRSLGALSNYKRMKKRKKKSLNLAQPFRSYDRKVVDRGTITVYIFRTTVPKPSSKLYVPASRLAEHAAKNDYTYSIPLQEQFVKHNSDDVIYKITYDDAFHGCSKMSEG